MIITISEQKGEELIKNIHDGIIRKLQSARQLVDFDKEISADLYTYALEEFGKFLLVKESKANNLYEINRNWFKSREAHKYKFTKAFDYLQKNHHEKCYILNKEGGFDPEGYDPRGFNSGLLSDFEARLSIFYSDFKSKGKDDNDIDIVKIPNVDKNMLETAINELENVINKLT